MGKQRLHLHRGQWHGFANTDTYAYTNTNIYAHAYSHIDTNGHTYCDSNRNANVNSDSHTHADINANTDVCAQSNSHANTDSDTWVRSSGDGKSGAGLDLYFFNRHVPMDCRQRESVCSDVGQPAERTRSLLVRPNHRAVGDSNRPTYRWPDSLCDALFQSEQHVGQQCLHIYGIQRFSFSHSYAHSHRRSKCDTDADGNSFAYADSNANRDTRFGSRGDQQSSARINSYFIDSYVHVERS